MHSAQQQLPVNFALVRSPETAMLIPPALLVLAAITAAFAALREIVGLIRDAMKMIAEDRAAKRRR